MPDAERQPDEFQHSDLFERITLWLGLAQDMPSLLLIACTGEALGCLSRNGHPPPDLQIRDNGL